MKTLALAAFVMIFAMSSTALSQVKELVAAGNSLATSRARVNSNLATDSGTDVRTLATTPKATSPSPRMGSAKNSSGAAPVALNQIYRVGVGDVLDVRVIDMPSGKSTLFTVLEGGMLDYPLSSAPVAVAALTPEEIAVQLQAQIKVLDNPKVSVKVRDYSSHSVIVTGSVLDPGVRFLRREATPLYVVLAESQPRSEAVKATITRHGVPVINVDLKDPNAVNTLVMPGDVIKVILAPPAPETFFYATGALNSPGQKAFHNGLTLTQAIIASGGVSYAAGTKVKVLRQGSDGRLSTTEYNLQQIDEGKIPDPVLQQGDRIAVSEGR